MKKIGIIIRREFLYRVKKRSFVLLTVLMPFLFAAGVIVPGALSSLKSDEQQKVVIIDRTGIYAPLFHDNESFSFVNSDKMQKSYRDEQSDVYAVLSIWDDLSKNETASRIYSRKEVSVELEQMVNSVLEKKIYEQRVASYGIPNLDKVMKECEVDFKVRTVRWSDNGDEKESSTAAAMFVGIFFTLLIYIFVLQYGGMVMQSVTEEKSNRIMELMVSSVKPFTLMLGKIVGVALVGLLQMFIWGVMLFIIMTLLGVWLGVPEVTSGMVGNTAMAAVPETGDAAQILSVIKGMNLMEIGVMFVLCFIGGYLFYASFFAGVGSAVNSSEDTGQFMVPTVVIMAFALYAGMFGINNPDGPLAFWCSMIPLTSPIVMMVRIPFGVPLWQELLSLLLLYASAFAMIWISGRIYRVGILMYGKKPSFRELAKWIRYK